jgi:signal recognition particle receptor subunit beta
MSRPASAPGLPIGAAVARAIAHIRAAADVLRPGLGRRYAAAVGEIVAGLERHPFKIAVIGQTKAGKSSLINALIRKPGFLPSDANPWTAVVTRLHFGVTGDGRKGMVFHFFTEEEWQELAGGGGPLAALMARLGPGVDRAVLLEQLGEIRRRAEQRLGRSFRHALGKQHRFSTVSEEVLERYVCAGEGQLDLSDDPAAGRFADITKLAELYFDPGPFACPTTVIDTPGTNDPLLVRDEMTHRQLGDADICIAVLSAQQALSNADLDLLRLLHGLHRDRVIVFVNRIDLLGDVVADSERVVANIRSRLAEIFPMVDVPVIAGSARWGEFAEHLLPADVTPLTTPALAAMGRHLGIGRSPEPGSARGRPSPDLDDFSRLLGACSGLQDLRAVISRLLVDEPGRLLIERAATAFGSELHSLDMTSSNELAALEAMTGAVTSDSKSVLRQLARIERDLRGLRPLQAALDAANRSFAHDLALMKEVGLKRLRVQLEGIVEAFADTEGASLEAATRQPPLPRIWRSDVNALRQMMGRRFLELFGGLAAQLLEFQETAVADLRPAIRAAAPSHALEIGYRPPHLINPTPSISALGRVIALDLGRPWFEWWQRWRQSDRKVKVLQQLIRSEFQPVIEQLLEAARAELDPHVTQAVTRLDAELKSAAGALQRHQRRFARLYVEALAARQRRPAEQLLGEFEARTRRHRRRQALIEQAKQQLKEAISALH